MGIARLEGERRKRTAFALAQEEKPDDLCLLSESFLALDVLVDFVAYSAGFCFVCEPLLPVLRGLVVCGLDGDVEGVWGLLCGHGLRS